MRQLGRVWRAQRDRPMTNVCYWKWQWPQMNAKHNKSTMNEPKSRAPTANCVAFPSAQHNFSAHNSNFAAQQPIFFTCSVAALLCFAYIYFISYVDSIRMWIWFSSVFLCRARKAHTCIQWRWIRRPTAHTVEIRWLGLFRWKTETRFLLSAILLHEGNHITSYNCQNTKSINRRITFASKFNLCPLRFHWHFGR